MWRRLCPVLLLSASLQSAVVLAAGSTRVPVIVRHAGVDPVGLELAARLRDVVAYATDLRLDAPEAADPRLVVILATVDGNVEEPGQQTAASVNIVLDADALPFNGYLIMALVQVCGVSRTHECALEIVETVRRAVAQVEAGQPELWEALKGS